MPSEPRPAPCRARRFARRVVAAALACSLAAAGCLSPPPSRESAPGAAPPPPAKRPPLPPTAAPAEPLPAAPLPAVDTDATLDPPEESLGAAPDDARVERAPPSARPASKARARRAAEGAGDAPASAAAAPGKPAALRAQLERAEQTATPDCPSARERERAVCDLAGRICRLTDRDPNVASVAEYCTEAKRRCGDAERRTAERCPR